MTACVAASMSSNYPGMNDHFWKPGLYRDLKMKRKRVSDICKSDMVRGRQDDFNDCDTQSEADSAYCSDFTTDDLPEAKVPRLSQKTEQPGFVFSKIKSNPHDLMAAWKSPKASSNLIMPCYSLPPGRCVLQPQQLLSMTSLVNPNCQTSFQFIPVISGNQSNQMTSSSDGHPIFVSTPHLPPLNTSNTPSGMPDMGVIKQNRSSMTPDVRATDSDSSCKSRTNDKPIKEQDFISHYTNGQFVYNGHLLDNPHNHGHNQFEKKNKEDGGVMMICAICQDRATGLHYGIITCEGCKGFFKRTVQNKRIYSCVATGDCEINRAQRNRCQFCRFKKCLEKGMVLAAVREDRMPGGRNSGAVYNLYKVKYKKHKKKDLGMKKVCYQSTMNAESMLTASSMSSLRNVDSFEQDYWLNGMCEENSRKKLSSSPLLQLPRLPGVPEVSENVTNSPDNRSASTGNGQCFGQDLWISSVSDNLDGGMRLNGRPRSPTNETKMEECKKLILELVEKDTLLGIAKSYGFEQLIANQDSVGQALCRIGDDIVVKLVHWIRNLPFYTEIPLKLQSQILTKKWHELLLLIMTAFGALDTKKRSSTCPLFTDLFRQNISKIQCYLNKTFGNSLSTNQLNKEVGPVIEKVTHIMLKFLSLRLSRQEFVCLQVILLLSQNDDISEMSGQSIIHIQERYMKVLQLYTKTQFSSQPYRFGELLLLLPQIKDASAMLLDSKMIYIPFLLNT